MKSEFYNCDNMEFMAKFPDGHFELAIVDPLYGIGADKAQNANGEKGEKWGFKQYKQTDWDSSIPSKEYFAELKRVSKNQIIWGGNYMTEHLPPSMGWIVWDKQQRDFSFADGELAWTSFKKALRIFELSRGKALANNNEDGGRIHPTQKPVRLYEWLLASYAKEGDKILDTHVGSGSSRIACHNLKFDFFGCELDEDYFKQAEARYQEHIRQEVLF